MNINIFKLTVIYFLIFTQNTFAFEWVKVVGAEDAVYIDITSIKNDRKFVFYKSLNDTPSMGVNSMIFTNKADCIQKKIIELKIDYFGQPMGKGAVIKEEKNIKKEINPKANTSKYKELKFVCNQKK